MFLALTSISCHLVDHQQFCRTYEKWELGWEFLDLLDIGVMSLH